uniref:Uncharacterized protein n=1 Tax=Rhizophora mucronata TaxID=61149 RepID=A0A2P2PW19_RHIMU
MVNNDVLFKKKKKSFNDSPPSYTVRYRSVRQQGKRNTSNQIINKKEKFTSRLNKNK